LFNLKNDIGEQHDLSASEPEMVEKLRNMLHKWRNDIDAQMMPPNPDYTDHKTQQDTTLLNQRVLR
jgi:hypothetical protein